MNDPGIQASFNIFIILRRKHASKRETTQGGEDVGLECLIDIIRGYSGLPEALPSLLNWIHDPVCLRLYSDIIDQTLQSYNPTGRSLTFVP